MGSMMLLSGQTMVTLESKTAPAKKRRGRALELGASVIVFALILSADVASGTTQTRESDAVQRGFALPLRAKRTGPTGHAAVHGHLAACSIVQGHHGRAQATGDSHGPVPSRGALRHLVDIPERAASSAIVARF